MIYQNLAVALAATSGLAAAAKPSYYSAAAPVSTPVGLGKIYDNRGFIQTTSFLTTAATVDARNDDAVYATYTSTAAPAPTTVVSAVEFIKDQSVPSKTPPTFFATWRGTTGKDGTVHVYQGFKRTSQKQWSQTQTLRPPSQFNRGADFGSTLASDVSPRPLVAVGCPGCNATVTLGQVYLYSPTPSGHWSYGQVLSVSAYGFTNFGTDVTLSENTLLASIKNTAGTIKSYTAFQRGDGPKDSFEYQQLLGVKGAVTVTSADVYQETIVLSNGAATHTSTSGAGEVYILYPSTEEFGLKPAGKPRPAQWSVQQVLRAAAPIASDAFGTSVAIDRNVLSVISASKSYIFTREEKSGQWSQQQIFTAASYTSTSAAGGNVIVSKAAGAFLLYSAQTSWKCIVISLEDQFGDGWDTAELIAAAPDGTHDYFSLGCDGTNPRQLRYCPNDRSDDGVYSFSVPEAIKSKFYWELQWSIFDENTGKWYRGQWDTKMDFEWDSDSLSFTPRKFDKLRANFTYCHNCPSKPTDKPTPVLRRNLKGGDDGSGTAFPTHTPAPTLLNSVAVNWRNLYLTTGNKPWFDYLYQGTEYYVSDPHGHRLIASGTTCLTTGVQTCWVDLPDGEYTLRVGGALDSNAASHQFSYCKFKNAKSVQQQLNFRIQDGDCSIVTLASRDAVCKSNGYNTLSNFYLVLNVNMIVHGTTLTTPTLADNTVFSSAVASLFHGMQSSDVNLVSVTPSGSSTFVSANIRMSSALGYNLLDIDEEVAFESYVKTAFSSRTNELSLAVALTSGAVASSFTGVSKVEFVDYRIVDSVESLPEEALSGTADLVASYSDSFTSSTSESTSTNSNTNSLVLDGISYSGYFLAAVGILFLVGFTIYKTQTSSSSNTHLPVPEDSETSPKIENGRRQLSKTSLTVGDLKELASMEQEYLKIVAK